MCYKVDRGRENVKVLNWTFMNGRIPKSREEGCGGGDQGVNKLMCRMYLKELSREVHLE